MEKIIADLVVLGAGPGGYVAAIRGAQLGLDTVVVEDGQVGGVCLNWGCIPSKALIQAADAFHRLEKELPAMGIRGTENATIDAEALQAWKNDIVKKLTSGVKSLFKGNKVRLIEGRGAFNAKDTLRVATAAGDVEIQGTKGVIIATGGVPIDLPGLVRDGDRIIGAKEAVSLKELPRRLAVIGGGVIGLELGTVWRKLGTEVTVVEMTPSILPGMDKEIVAAVSRRLRQLKIQVFTGARAAGVEDGPDGLRLAVEKDGQTTHVVVDKVLVAVGMRPHTDGLGLAAAGVELTTRGFIQTDEYCQTNVKGIYAIGDIAGQPMLAHKASFEGEVAAQAIAGNPHRTKNTVIPSAVFTDPEIGVVGMTEEQAVAAGREVKIGKFFFAASGKAMALQETGGLVKVVADAATGETLGVHIAGPHASDLLAEAAVAVSKGMKVTEIGHIVHAHPTLAEVLAESFLDVNGQAIHAVRR